MLTQFQTFTFLSNFQVGLEPNKYLPLERKCFFFTSHLTTHLIWDPHSKLYDDLHSSWSAGFGGCHDDDDDDFYDDLLRSWSAGFGGCHDVDNDDDNDEDDDHDDGDRDIETYQRWQPVAGKVVTQRILSIVALHISQSLEFTSEHIGIVLYCIAIVKKSTNLVIWDTKSGLKLWLKKTDSWLRD